MCELKCNAKKKQFKMHRLGRRGEDRFWCLHLDTSSAVVFNRYHVSVKLVSEIEAHNGMVSTDETETRQYPGCDTSYWRVVSTVRKCRNLIGNSIRTKQGDYYAHDDPGNGYGRNFEKIPQWIGIEW